MPGRNSEFPLLVHDIGHAASVSDSDTVLIGFHGLNCPLVVEGGESFVTVKSFLIGSRNAPKENRHGAAFLPLDGGVGSRQRTLERLATEMISKKILLAAGIQKDLSKYLVDIVSSCVAKGAIVMKIPRLKNMVTMLIFVFALCFSGLCYAAVTFQADGGKDFVLDFNNKNSFGRYMLLDANGSVVFTFDFNGNTQEFTTYKPDGSLLAIRKMLSWDRMLHKEKPNYDYIVCVRRSDGDYYRENHSSPSFYEHTPKAFNTFLQNKAYFGVA